MGLDIDMITIAKQAINSTIGTENFKPLSEQIQDMIDEYTPTQDPGTQTGGTN